MEEVVEFLCFGQCDQAKLELCKPHIKLLFFFPIDIILHLQKNVTVELVFFITVFFCILQFLLLMLGEKYSYSVFQFSNAGMMMHY